MLNRTKQTQKNFLTLGALLLMIGLAAPAWAAPPAPEAPGVTLEAGSRGVRSTRKASARSTVARKRKAPMRSGAYVNGGLGVVTASGQPQGVTIQDGTLALVGLGYRFSPELAVEGNLQAQFHDVLSDGDSAGSNTLTGGSLSLKYFFPVAMPRIEGYAQGGLGYLSLASLPGLEDAAGPTLELGGGIEYRTNKQFAFGGRLGYSTFLGNNSPEVSQFGALSAMLTINVQL